MRPVLSLKTENAAIVPLTIMKLGILACSIDFKAVLARYQTSTLVYHSNYPVSRSFLTVFWSYFPSNKDTADEYKTKPHTRVRDERDNYKSEIASKEPKPESDE